MVTDCIACGLSNGDPSRQMPQMHVRCWLDLPEVTRNLYLHGGLQRPRLVQIAKERSASYREVRRK